MSDIQQAQPKFPEDPVLGDDGYPTDAELDRIKNWPGLTQEDGIALMAYIHERWKYDQWGWEEIEDRFGARFYELHTGGWSGNEDLESALESTLLGLMALQSYQRGGHFLFVFKKTSP